MNLNLLIPDLFWPDTSQQNIYEGLSIPRIEALLSKSTSSTSSPQEMEIWLCQKFNIAQRQNNWPIAAVMLHKDAPALVKASKDFWMRADPVHLRIEQNHIMLADCQAFQITEEEANELIQDINHNFGHEDFTLLPLQPNRWYIRLPTIPEMQTHTLSQVTCKNINNFLPSGVESIKWHNIFNEIQMLLHEHPVNQARESRGELTINSIWLWGGGNMPQYIQSPYTHVWSNNDFPHALALANNINHSKLPLNADEWLMTQPTGDHLVVLDSLRGKAKYRNAYLWRETLIDMERDWFSPLYTALWKGKINQLTITSLNETSSQDFALSRSGLWKFWRIASPLSIHSKKTLTGL